MNEIKDGLSMQGDIKRFGRKGYEAISREMLQDSRLSFREIGLLAHMASHSDNYKIHKTKLYKRHLSEKRTVIEKSWNRLVELGYIVQYKKRVGQKDEYQYVFEVDPYTIADLNEIDKEMKTYGYSHHLSKKIRFTYIDNVLLNKTATAIENWALTNLAENSPKVLLNDLVERQVDVISFIGMLYNDTPNNAAISRVIGMLSNNTPKNTVKSTNSGMLSGNSSQTTDNKTINKKNFKEVEDINNNVIPSFNNNSGYKNQEIYIVERLFLESKINPKDTYEILSTVDTEFSILFDPNQIIDQLTFIVNKLRNNEPIYSMHKFFIDGLRKRLQNREVQEVNQQLVADIKTTLGVTEPAIKPVPMYNWLEEYKKKLNE